MKKTYILFVSTIVIASLLLYSCQPNNSNNELKTIIYGLTENSAVFNTNEKEYEKFEACEYKEDISKDTVTINILGTKYTGIYTKTVKLPRMDTEVYDYKLEGTENGRVLINTKTGAVVEYVCIPHNENLIAEDDYVNFIKQMIGNSCDLKSYDYRCTTHYYSFSSKAMSSEVVDGFRICEENDQLGSYSFFYSKSENGIRMPGHISAEIDEDTFYLEVYEYDYKSTVFPPILDKIDEVEASIENHLRNSLKEGFTLVSIEYGSKSVFVQDGNPYIMISSTVTYKTEHGDEFSTIVKTITG